MRISGSVSPSLRNAAAITFVTCALHLSSDASLYAQSSSAQDSFPKSILIISFLKQSRGLTEFGDSAAAETIRLLAKSTPIKAVSWKEVLADLPIYLRAPDCIVGMQAALKARIEMLMCSAFEQTAPGKFVIHAQIILIASNKPIELPRIEASTPADAARQMVKEVERILTSPVRQSR